MGDSTRGVSGRCLTAAPYWPSANRAPQAGLVPYGSRSLTLPPYGRYGERTPEETLAGTLPLARVNAVPARRFAQAPRQAANVAPTDQRSRSLPRPVHS